MHVISHFLNEEFLLPYWLRHHVPMFEHGIMIDWGSTDRSVEIIREYAPTWEIRRTSVEFREPLIGKEIQKVETAIKGWKVVLNTTEFLVCPDLRQFVDFFAAQFPSLPGFRATGVVMIDSEEEQHRPLTAESLLLQRRHGVVEQAGRPNVVTGSYGPSRCRFIHRMPEGAYATGRHTTMYQPFLNPIDRRFTPQNYPWKGKLEESVRPQDWAGIHPEIFICWFGRYSPYEAIKRRVAYFDFHIPRLSFLGRQVPNAEDDLSLLNQELEIVRLAAYRLEEEVPLYGKYLALL